MGFAAGFFNALADDIDTRKAEIRERTARQREQLRQEGLQRQAAVSKVRSQLGQAASDLKLRGVDPRTIAALVKTDPQQLVSLAGTKATGDMINQSVRVAEDFSYEGNISDLIKGVTTTFADSGDPVTRERNIFQYMFGLGGDDAAYGEEVLPGVRGQDVVASRGMPVYSRGDSGPVSRINIGGLSPERDNRYSPAEQTKITENFWINTAKPSINDAIRNLNEMAIDSQYTPEEKAKFLEEKQMLEGFLKDDSWGALDEILPFLNSAGVIDEKFISGWDKVRTDAGDHTYINFDAIDPYRPKRNGEGSGLGARPRAEVEVEPLEEKAPTVDELEAVGITGEPEKDDPVVIEGPVGSKGRNRPRVQNQTVDVTNSDGSTTEVLMRNGKPVKFTDEDGTVVEKGDPSFQERYDKMERLVERQRGIKIVE